MDGEEKLAKCKVNRWSSLFQSIKCVTFDLFRGGIMKIWDLGRIVKDKDTQESESERSAFVFANELILLDEIYLGVEEEDEEEEEEEEEE